MNRSRPRAFLLFLALLCLGLISGATAAPLVIVISWDGLRHDFPDRGEFPGLARMETEGVRAERMIAGWPSNTFPGHVNLATGTWPDRHGIVNNTFFDRATGREYDYSGESDWLEAEPLWIATERQGIKTATYFWVGSESTWRGQRQSYQMTPFDSSVPESEKVDQMLDWIDLPESQRPGLIMAYWRGVDSVAHSSGPDSDRVTEQIAQQDGQLQRLLAGIDERELWADTTLILVSDHGMAAATEETDLRGALAALDSNIRVTGAGALAQVYLDSGAQVTESVVLAQIRRLEGLDAWPVDSVPDRLRMVYPGRHGDIVVVATLPHFIGYARGSGPAGSHGFDPNHPDMGAVFMAIGRNVPGSLAQPLVKQIDLAPTVTKLLGVQPPRDAEGSPLF